MKYSRGVIAAALGGLAVTVLLHCELSKKSGAGDGANTADRKFVRLVYDTFGGGQIHFEVVKHPAAAGSFLITVESYNHQESVKTISLDVVDNGLIHAALTDLFDGKRELAGSSSTSTSGDSDLPTGSWTHVTIEDADGKIERIFNDELLGTSESLRAFVTERGEFEAQEGGE